MQIIMQSYNKLIEKLPKAPTFKCVIYIAIIYVLQASFILHITQLNK